MINRDKIQAHLFEREYMSGVERDQNRVKSTGEVFTPDAAVQQMLDKIPADFFSNPGKTAIDPACGDGQWLAEVLWRKLEAGHDFEQALSTIYGVDIMEDNVIECRRRLLCGHEELRPIVERNIVYYKTGSLDYDFSFNGTNFTNKELQEQEEAKFKASLPFSTIPAATTIKKQSKPKFKPVDIWDESLANGLFEITPTKS